MKYIKRILFLAACLFSAHFTFDNDQPIAAPPSPNSTELQTWPMPQMIVQKIVRDSDQPRDFESAMKGK